MLTDLEGRLTAVRALIIGAGVGGLAAARGLLADGHEVEVFEQAPALRAGGAAVTLWSNGTGILNELKVSLEGVGTPIEVMEQRDQGGRLLLAVDVSRSAARYGHPHVCLPRVRLLERLADGLPPGVVSYGRACTGFSHDTAGGVRVEFADGSHGRGDVLIGADGRNSVIRDALWGHDPAEPSGWATWQGVTALSVATPGKGVLFTGKAGLCGLMPAGEGLLQWWFDQRWTPGTPLPAAPVAALRERFGDWAAPVREVLAAVTDAEAGFFPHYRQAVPATWGAGPVTLAGDAAHSMPPTRAQGANQALEDAWALAAALRRGGNVADALRDYEHTRSRTVGFVARQAAKEGTNEIPPWMVRLVPAGLAATLYTRWLRQASNYLS